MATPLEQALGAIVSTFQKHAEVSGNKHRLCQAELKELLQKELPTWTPTGLRECDYSAFMSALGTNKDCEVGFVEYVRSLACLCTFCHDYFKDGTPATPCSQQALPPQGRGLLQQVLSAHPAPRLWHPS